eukprot:6180793-Pleurochrysis_carterae.AAC.2
MVSAKADAAPYGAVERALPCAHAVPGAWAGTAARRVCSGGAPTALPTHAKGGGACSPRRRIARLTVEHAASCMHTLKLRCVEHRLAGARRVLTERDSERCRVGYARWQACTSQLMRTRKRRGGAIALTASASPVVAAHACSWRGRRVQLA